MTIFGSLMASYDQAQCFRGPRGNDFTRRNDCRSIEQMDLPVIYLRGRGTALGLRQSRFAAIREVRERGDGQQRAVPWIPRVLVLLPSCAGLRD